MNKAVGWSNVRFGSFADKLFCAKTQFVRFGPKADIRRSGFDVRFVPKADITPTPSRLRYNLERFCPSGCEKLVV
jgi:hypothetical protein